MWEKTRLRGVSISLVYITAKNKKEARKIGQALVKARLAAGVNIIDKISSIYRWKGRIRNKTEAILIAKTKKSLVKKLIEKVKALHSYACPCIVAIPIIDGNLNFLDWVQKETL